MADRLALAQSQGHGPDLVAYGGRQENGRQNHRGRGVRDHRGSIDYLIKTTGLTQEQIAQQWNNGRWRSAPEQMIIADAIAHEAARESMRNLNAKRAFSPVQAPGAYQPTRGAADLDQVRAIERALDGATGKRALELGRQLIQAKRAAGLLQIEG